MNKKLSDEALLEKICNACTDIENTPEIDDEEFFKQYINETKSIMSQKAKSHKILFSTIIPSFLSLIIIISCFIFIPKNDNRRYSDFNDNVVVSVVEETNLQSVLPNDLQYVSTLFDAEIDVIKLYSESKLNVAIHLRYKNLNQLFISLVRNFDYSDHESYVNSNSVVEHEDEYTVYTNIITTKEGRNILTNYYILIDTEKYDFYLYFYSSNDAEIAEIKQEIINNL